MGMEIQQALLIIKARLESLSQEEAHLELRKCLGDLCAYLTTILSVEREVVGFRLYGLSALGRATGIAQSILTLDETGASSDVMVLFRVVLELEAKIRWIAEVPDKADVRLLHLGYLDDKKNQEYVEAFIKYAPEPKRGEFQSLARLIKEQKQQKRNQIRKLDPAYNPDVRVRLEDLFSAENRLSTYEMQYAVACTPVHSASTMLLNLLESGPNGGVRINTSSPRELAGIVECYIRLVQLAGLVGDLFDTPLAEDYVETVGGHWLLGRALNEVLGTYVSEP